MRISQQQSIQIKKIAQQKMGANAIVWLFGSRVDDNAKGGDIDLLIETDQSVAESVLIAASIATKVMRLFNGRKTDVIIQAPNLKHLPIHDIAQQTGIKL